MSEANDPAVEELQAALASCALADRSDLARLVGTGPDLLDLLNRLSTGAVDQLEPGEGVATVLTTPKGRIVERLYVHRRDAADVLLTGGAGRAEPVAAHLARFTFVENTGLEDVSGKTFQLALHGPRGADTLRAAGLPVPGTCHVARARCGDVPLDILGQDGFSDDGFSLVGAAADREPVWRRLAAAVESVGGRPAAGRALAAWRVLRGLPASGHELTEDYNPLEAGLWSAVNFDKGCYVGQEVVARLRTYDKVSRQIVGLELPEGASLPDPGTPLYVAGREVGRVTSAATIPGRSAPRALGYVKRRVLRPELELLAGDAETGLPVRVAVESFAPRSI